MATLQAIENRRRNRRAASAAKADRRNRRPAAEREQAVAVRMKRRFFSGEDIDLMLLDYRYYQIRRCGWDVLSEGVRTIGHDRAGGRILCDATDTVQWRWWCSLHPKERNVLVVLSELRLVRSVKITGLRRQPVGAN